MHDDSKPNRSMGRADIRALAAGVYATEIVAPGIDRWWDAYEELLETRRAYAGKDFR